MKKNEVWKKVVSCWNRFGSFRKRSDVQQSDDALVDVQQPHDAFALIFLKKLVDLLLLQNDVAHNSIEHNIEPTWLLLISIVYIQILLWISLPSTVNSFGLISIPIICGTTIYSFAFIIRNTLGEPPCYHQEVWARRLKRQHQE